MTYGRDHRSHAAASFLDSDGNIAAATRMFVNRCKQLGLKVPRDPRKFVILWGSRQQQNGSVDTFSSNSGRKPKLSKQQAATVLSELLNWAEAGQQGPYSSIKQFKQSSATARRIIERAGVSDSAVLRALRRIQPRLAYKKLTIKQKLTAAQKAERVRQCLEKLLQPDRTLHRVHWIDAKVMYMTIRQRNGWVLPDEELPFSTTVPGSKKSPKALRYYISVNYLIGSVTLVYVTGTTGLDPNRNEGGPYLVSSCAE